MVIAPEVGQDDAPIRDVAQQRHGDSFEIMRLLDRRPSAPCRPDSFPAHQAAPHR
jgi:hypothetical protein